MGGKGYMGQGLTLSPLCESPSPAGNRTHWVQVELIRMLLQCYLRGRVNSPLQNLSQILQLFNECLFERV